MNPNSENAYSVSALLAPDALACETLLWTLQASLFPSTESNLGSAGCHGHNTHVRKGEKVRNGITDTVQLKGRLKEFFLFWHCFASSLSPLKYRTFIREICLKERQVCPSNVPLRTAFKPDRVTSSTLRKGSLGRWGPSKGSMFWNLKASELPVLLELL